MPKLRKAATNDAASLSTFCIIDVHVAPRSSRNSIEQQDLNTYKIKLTAPPVEGKANEQLVTILSECLGLPKQQIEIVGGSKSRHKLIKIRGLSDQDVHKLLTR